MFDVYNEVYFDKISKIYRESLKETEKGIFVDCGGFDGCSAIKFITINPEFDCVTFEPNPDLWKYYHVVPTTLIKAAAFDKNEKCKFILDDINRVGSTLIPSKGIKSTSNNLCRRIEVSCIRLSNFIETLSKTYNKIILKLDVEGAEYAILDDLILKKQDKNISKLYAEFHWFKCDMNEYSEYRHELLIHKLVDSFPVCEWDASMLDVANRPKKFLEIRESFLNSRFRNIKQYQNLKFGEIYE